MSDEEIDQRSSLAAIRAAIGCRLRLVREKLGESQTKFAERLGVAKLALLTYEAGGRCPGSDQLCLLSASGVDASFVAFGVPSLATPESRRQFASTLAWVRHECAVSSLQVSEAGLVEAAWLVFSELSKRTPAFIPGDEELRQRARAAIGALGTSEHVVG
jgi:transcriptional regulator with XRE-family HTH domain